MMRALLPVLLLVASCSRRGPPATPEAQPCRRVVAYSPAIAELMFQLGLGEAVVGISRWTSLPAGERRPVVGDAQVLDMESLLAVRADCVFTQLTTAAPVDGMRAAGVRVVPFEIEMVPEIRAATARLGRLVGRPEAGAAALQAFDARMAAVRAAAAAGAAPSAPRPRVLFVLGTDRPAVALGDTFIDDLIVAAGGVNAGREIAVRGRWRSTDLEAIVAARPDVVVCQVPAAADESAARAYWQRWQALPAARSGRIHVVSDPGWTIPTLRLAEQAEKLQRMLQLRTPAP